MAEQRDRANVQMALDREMLSEVDRLATLWDLYRYEVMEELLRIALKEVEDSGYRPARK